MAFTGEGPSTDTEGCKSRWDGVQMYFVDENTTNGL